MKDLNMKTINWNEASKLGLIERINRDVLHPLGLAMSRNPETGVSENILISNDGVWEYPSNMKSTLKTDDEIRYFTQNK